MNRYVCRRCRYIYDSHDNGNVAFNDLGNNWKCPTCGVGKEMFSLIIYDILYMKDFAVNNNFGETGILTYNQVKNLASLWMPVIYFHEAELYHPISFNDFTSERDFSNDEYIDVYETSLVLGDVYKKVPPPVIIQSHDNKKKLENLNDINITSDSYVTIIKYPKDEEGTPSLEISKKYFGSILLSNNVQMPRYPIKIIVEYKTLLETMKQNLLADIDDDYPRSNGSILDAVRKDFTLEDYINLNEWSIEAITKRKKQEILDLINFVEGTDYNREEELEKLKLLGCIELKVWDAITKYSILTYYFIYHYNYALFDISLLGIPLIESLPVSSYYHEGEVEGCALFFDKSKFTVDNLDLVLDQITPDCLITLAHAQYQNLDEFCSYNGYSVEEIKENLLKVWVARGSHATYLSGPGNKDIIDIFIEISNGNNEKAVGSFFTVFFIDPATAIAMYIALKCLDSAVSICDVASENGVFTGSEQSDDPNYVSTELIVTPLSKEDNIYANLEDQVVNDSSIRVYPGKWGKDDSPDFVGRTWRFFDMLIKNIE